LVQLGSVVQLSSTCGGKQKNFMMEALASVDD